MLILIFHLATLQDVREEYAEMREEFLAGLEDRRYLTIAEARAKRLQVGRCCRGDNPIKCTRSVYYYMLKARVGAQMS